MGSRPTIVDVAARCGVSKATVSKVLNQPAERSEISAETRARVLAAVEEMGYLPGWQARSNALRRHHAIGLGFAGRTPVSYGIYPLVFAALEQALDRAGLGLRFVGFEAQGPPPIAPECDGLIAIDPLPRDLAAWSRRVGLPVVVVNHDSDLGLPRVVCDEAAAAAALVEHLVALGHRRLVYVQEDRRPGHPSEAARRAAVADEIQRHGLECSFVTDLRHEAFTAAAIEHGSGAAVVAYNHRDATKVLAAARTAGLAVPDDLSLVCFDDLPHLDLIDPPLTRVSTPIDELVREAVAILLSLVERREAPPQDLRVVVAGRLSVGSSAAAP